MVEEDRDDIARKFWNEMETLTAEHNKQIAKINRRERLIYVAIVVVAILALFGPLIIAAIL